MEGSDREPSFPSPFLCTALGDPRLAPVSLCPCDQPPLFRYVNYKYPYSCLACAPVLTPRFGLTSRGSPLPLRIGLLSPESRVEPSLSRINSRALFHYPAFRGSVPILPFQSAERRTAPLMGVQRRFRCQHDRLRSSAPGTPIRNPQAPIAHLSRTRLSFPTQGRRGPGSGTGPPRPGSSRGAQKSVSTIRGGGDTTIPSPVRSP